MKAYSIVEPFQVAICNVPFPEPADDEVLVKVCYVGLCGSDLNSYRGLMPLVTFPRIPGHEISGIIERKGKNVPDYIKIGDKVTIQPYTNCGICASCRKGFYNACENNQTLGVQRDGGLTEYISVHYSKVYHSSLLSLKELALVEPFCVGYHGVNRGMVKETDTVAIIGCGTIGLGAIAAASRKGATVIGIDIDENKLALAKKFGASFTMNSSVTDPQKAIDAFTNNLGVDVAIEAAGTPHTFSLAMDIVSFSGSVVTIGYSKKETQMNTQIIVKKELNIFGSRNALNEFTSVIKMFEKQMFPFSDIISAVFPFEKTPEAFKYWDGNHSVTKILIEVNH